MKRIFNYVTIVILSIFAVACSDDEPIPGKYDSSIEDNGMGGKTSIFHLTYSEEAPTVTNEDTNVHLIQVGGNYINTFDAVATISGSNSIISVKADIPNGQNIPDGEYVLKLGENVSTNRYVVDISGMKISEKKIDNGNYASSLASILNSGNGTETKPFKINEADKFNKFVKCLMEDAYHGAGFYFTQTKTFEWEQDESTVGTGYTPQTFAGVYDGGNYSIKNITANGADDIGLFSKLTNGATVKNLKIENISITNASSTVGAIAGSSEYTVAIENISTTGNISGSTNIGGIIGHASGVLSIKNISLNTTISGTYNMGGLIGLADNSASITIDNVSTGNTFSVDNNNASNAVNVGGAIGLVNSASFNISNFQLDHSIIKEEASKAKIINGKSYVGGVIGCISSLSAAASIENSSIIAPINAADHCGGYIGSAELNNSFSISNCIFSGDILNADYAGGFIGALKNCSNFKFSDNKYVDDSNGDSYISARSYVGGYFGQLSEGTLSLSGSNYLMVTINGSSIVGGIAGYIENVDLNVGIPLYSSQSAADASGIEITGTEYLGGLVGKMLSSSLSGPQNLNPTSSIPSFDNNNTVFIGNITGNGTCIGGAVGRADKSSVKGISVRATITNNSGNYTGGIVGYFNEGNKAISSCSFSGPISGKNYTGGIVGEINTLAQVTQCINYGSITGENPTGGIVGKANNKTDEPWINECVNVGKVKGSQHVGGIVGLISADGDEAHDWTKVARCGNFGAITASSSGNGCVGGIVGKCDSDKIRVNDCANNDSVTGYGSFKGIGGIAGSLGKDGILNELDNVDVYNCANTGKIISDKNGESHMGGIVGYLEEGDEGSNDTNSQVHLCYNCGEVGPAKSATHGGIIGHADYYVSLRYCINYGKTGTDGEAMIGTVVTGGIVHDTALYHLKGTGDNSGRNWSSTEFTESQMNSLSTFKGFSSSDWKVGKQINMSGSGENNKDRVILVSCPFQNMTAPK